MCYDVPRFTSRMDQKLGCRHCNLAFDSLKHYISHQNVHFNQKNSSFLCPVGNCSQKLNTESNFYAHRRMCHGDKYRDKFSGPSGVLQNSVTQCPLASCQKFYQQKSELMKCCRKHLRDGMEILCPFFWNDVPCTRTFQNVPNFNTHVSQYHRQLVQPSTSQGNLQYVSQEGCQSNQVATDPFPRALVKKHVGNFYLRLEGHHLWPSKTVQEVNREVHSLLNISHHSIRRSFTEELSLINMTDELKMKVETALSISLLKDPVMSVHRIDPKDPTTQLFSIHRRQTWLKNQGKFVAPIQITLGVRAGRKRYLHRISLRETLELLFKDPSVQRELDLSFTRDKTRNSDVFEDYTDGSVYQNHPLCSKEDCIEIIWYGDCYNLNPFLDGNPLKIMGFYLTLGNVRPFNRSKLEAGLLSLLAANADIQVFGYKKILKPTIEEFNELSKKGIVYKGRTLPVVVLYYTGDNEGSHGVGGFVTCFTASHICRYCDIPWDKFVENPVRRHPLRTPESYEDCIKERPPEFRLTSLSSHTESEQHHNYGTELVDEEIEMDVREMDENQLEQSEDEETDPEETEEEDESLDEEEEEGNESDIDSDDTFMISEDYVKPSSYHYKGVVESSVLNFISNFHVCEPALPPCLAHDLFEGVIKYDLALIISALIKRGYFTIQDMNNRLNEFKYQGSDSNNPPCRHLKEPLKKIPGSSSKIWGFLRILPFIVGDLVDNNDEYWQLFLTIKRFVEFTCAPKISDSQLAILQGLVERYVSERKRLFPSVRLRPKHHYLIHYAELIYLFGPLIRLWSLRFESMHKVFKKAAKHANNCINLTYTSAKKYQLNCAYRNTGEIFPPDVQIISSSPLKRSLLKPEIKDLIPSTDVEDVSNLIFRGTTYKPGSWMVLGRQDSPLGLKMGEINLILYDSKDVFVIFRVCSAENSFNGYYEIIETSAQVEFVISRLDDEEEVLDFYPLQAYMFGGKKCLTLHHTSICI